jgi:hypothetical protein
MIRRTLNVANGKAYTHSELIEHGAQLVGEGWSRAAAARYMGIRVDALNDRMRTEDILKAIESVGGPVELAATLPSVTIRLIGRAKIPSDIARLARIVFDANLSKDDVAQIVSDVTGALTTGERNEAFKMWDERLAAVKAETGLKGERGGRGKKSPLWMGLSRTLRLANKQMNTIKTNIGVRDARILIKDVDAQLLIAKAFGDGLRRVIKSR